MSNMNKCGPARLAAELYDIVYELWNISQNIGLNHEGEDYFAYKDAELNYTVSKIESLISEVRRETDRDARIDEDYRAEKFARNEVFGAMPISLARYFRDRITQLRSESGGGE